MISDPKIDLDIDVKDIAFQFGKVGLGADGTSSVASNEQLVFRSDMDGKSNNCDLLKDEILNKLNPAMYR